MAESQIRFRYARMNQTMKLFSLGLFILLVLLSWVLFDWGKYAADPYLIREAVGNHIFWAPLLFIVLQTFVETLLVPGMPFSIAGGLLFGTMAGSAYSILSSTISAMAVFYIARYIGDQRLLRYLSGRFRLIQRYGEKLHKDGFRYVLFARLLPFTPGNALSVSFGMTGVTAKDHLLGTFLGNLPSTILLSYAGSFLINKDPTFLLGVGISLTIASFLVFFYPARKSQTGTSQNPTNNI